MWYIMKQVKCFLDLCKLTIQHYGEMGEKLARSYLWLLRFKISLTSDLKKNPNS